MSFVDIKILGLDELTVDIKRLREGASFRWPKEIMDGSAEMMKDAIRDETPRGPSGDLKNSVIIETSHDMRRIIVDSPYGVYVNDGTGPSPGRYVRALGKRLINPPRGMHPGIKATHFFDKGVEFASSRIVGFMYRKIGEFLRE